MTSRFICIALTLTCWNALAQAEGLNSLTLTPSEMQKLKQYFPEEDKDHKNLVWQGDPLTISLSKNKEKRLIFPSQVLVDVKGNLKTDQLRLINNNKSLYLTSLSAFPKTRINITLQDSGEVILIDLVVDEHASQATQSIQVMQSVKHASTKSLSFQQPETEVNTGINAAETPAAFNVGEDVSTVDLMRFAYQQLYAPLRLRQTNFLYTRAAMQTASFVPDLVYGDKVVAHPIASWAAGNRYVTVVALQNKYLHTTRIDIRQDLCGDWQAAVIYPRSTLLFHEEQQHDSTPFTTLFLVSQKPFSETLGACHGDA